MTSKDVRETSIRGLDYTFGKKWTPEQGDVKKVAAGVWWLRMPLPYHLDHINLWLLEDGDGWTVVDTSVDLPQNREFWEGVFNGVMAGAPVKRVIVTHMHPDHVGLAGWMTRKFNCDLWMSRTDFLMCRTLAADTGKEAPDVAIEFYKAAGWEDAALDEYKKRFGGFGESISTLPDAFRRLVEGETIEINDRIWQIVTGSGHTPEHICLYCPGLKLLISGDQVLPRISPIVSVFPTEPEGDPLRDWLDSCVKLRSVLPDSVLVLPAHQEPFYGLHSRLTSLIEGHEKGLDRLYDLLKEPKRVIDCFSVLFKRKIGPDLLGMATGETLAHLNCLLGRRMIVKERDDDGIDWYRQRKASEADH